MAIIHFIIMSADNTEMFVIKRGGEKQEVSFDKILRRIKTLVKKHN